MNTIEQLTYAQEKIHEQINFISKSHNLKQEPIYDGVGSIAEYLKSPMKIMWVLKEAYDMDTDGNIGNGDWIDYNLFNEEESCNIKTYRGMAYVMYGFYNDIYWGDSRFPKMNIQMLKLLNSTAYININKMPANQQTKSNDSDMRLHYNMWKNIINNQIHEYAPDVIIFAGTFKFFYNPTELKNDLKECFENTDMSINKKALIYKHNDQWMISVHHPCMYGEVYIDTLIDALKYVKDRI